MLGIKLAKNNQLSYSTTKSNIVILCSCITDNEIFLNIY